jgi:UDP-glucuronate 4-epimerase
VLDKPPVRNAAWSANSPDPASSQAPYKIYNIGNHQPILLSDFISTLEKVLDKEAKKNFKDLQPGDVPDTFADCRKLQNDFDYHPNTPLEEGLRNFAEWYQSYY